MSIAFELLAGGDHPVGPRAGVLSTPHGDVPTPAFMPVGTLGTVKSLLPEEVAATGASILLVNAYHLYLRPGHEAVARAGGIHHFMDWHRPILSDSGGFQVFSLATLRKVDDSGVRFRTHIDGSEHHYTPELAMEVQRALGVDIAMPLDHVVAGGAPRDEAEDAARRTLRWFERSREAAGETATFAIVQGGTDEELRRWQARELVARDAPGYSVGGLSVGESKATMWRVLETVTAELPVHRPRYLMGVGSPEDLVEGIARGVDLFDCVLPTRLGRNGALFTAGGRVNITNARFATGDEPFERDCGCLACTRFSAAYLHHLFRNDELLGYRLATIHNLAFLGGLVARARGAALAGCYAEFSAEFLARYQVADEGVRSEQRARWQAREGGRQRG